MATLADIARLANVSESAVSRALHDHPRIPEATRNRIKKIAADLDFEFNSHARSLSTRRSGTVGIIVPNFGAEVRRTYYLELLINDIRAELSALGFDLLIADSSVGPRGSNLRRLVRQNKVDGLVLIIAELRDEDKEALEKRPIPVVLVNSKPLELSTQVDALPTYFTDNRRGGALAANHLLDRGCLSLLCVADTSAGPEMVDRTLGFQAALDARGVTGQTLSVPADFESTLRLTLEHPLFGTVDGVFCHTDVMACAVLRGLQERGRVVPSEVKLVGYDDIELGTYFAPGLTTIHQPREEIARLACRHLADALASPGHPILHRSVEPSLVVRGST